MGGHGPHNRPFSLERAAQTLNVSKSLTGVNGCSSKGGEDAKSSGWNLGFRVQGLPSEQGTSFHATYNATPLRLCRPLLFLRLGGGTIKWGGGISMDCISLVMLQEYLKLQAQGSLNVHSIPTRGRTGPQPTKLIPFKVYRCAGP